jgi:hypothetical protein
LTGRATITPNRFEHVWQRHCGEEEKEEAGVRVI